MRIIRKRKKEGAVTHWRVVGEALPPRERIQWALELINDEVWNSLVEAIEDGLPGVLVVTIPDDDSVEFHVS